MKTLKLLIASLLLVTQSYAFSKNERNILLGLGVGALAVAALNAKNVHVTRGHFVQPAYVDSHYDRQMHKRDIRRENRAYKKELRRAHKRQVRRENLRHERKVHKEIRYNRHHDRQAAKHARKHARHHNESYAYNYDDRPHRYNYRY